MKERHLARLILVHHPDGSVQRHQLAVAEFHRREDGTVCDLTITPFSFELPGTIYHDEELHLYLSPQR